jgi:hypothetical protein
LTKLDVVFSQGFVAMTYAPLAQEQYSIQDVRSHVNIRICSNITVYPFIIQTDKLL